MEGTMARCIPPVISTAHAALVLALAFAAPAQAQDEGQIPASREDTVYDGDWLSVGFGLGVSPTYAGSNDYELLPVPLVQGSIAGIDIEPRQAGLALDFIPNRAGKVGFSFGPTVRLRLNRSGDSKDPAVDLLPERSRAIELGPSAGISLPGVLNPYDSLSFNFDARWDVSGVHHGFVLDPGLTYFTPVSRGAAISLTLDAEHNSSRYMDYYYSVSAADAAASGLPQFQAHGGWSRVSVVLLGGVDFDGDLSNGGLAAFAAGSYGRALGDVAASPLTSIRGSANQFLGAIGLGYTF
jgi:outer membrane scaffolding protein for murein synthesis (MipA/OmpV family)